MTTHTHFIIGSYAALVIAVTVELYLLRRHRKHALLIAKAIENEAV
jgi:hypothetical protein